MKSNLKAMIGQAIKDTRLESGKNMRDIVGISIGHLSNIERAQKNVSPELLEYLCQSLGIPVSEMLYKVADYMKELENGKKKREHYGIEAPGVARNHKGIVRWN